MVTRPVNIGRRLAACGVVLFFVGAGFCIGFLFGLFPRFTWAGVVAMFIGDTIAWFGNSLAAGTLGSDLRAKLQSEANDSCRLRTRLSPVTAVLVVFGFMMVLVAGIVVWWVLTQNAT